PHSYSQPARAQVRSITISRCRSESGPRSKRLPALIFFHARSLLAMTRNNMRGSPPLITSSNEDFTSGAYGGSSGAICGIFMSFCYFFSSKLGRGLQAVLQRSRINERAGPSGLMRSSFGPPVRKRRKGLNGLDQGRPERCQAVTGAGRQIDETRI